MNVRSTLLVVALGAVTLMATLAPGTQAKPTFIQMCVGLVASDPPMLLVAEKGAAVDVTQFEVGEIPEGETTAPSAILVDATKDPKTGITSGAVPFGSGGEDLTGIMYRVQGVTDSAGKRIQAPEQFGQTASATFTGEDVPCTEFPELMAATVQAAGDVKDVEQPDDKATESTKKGDADDDTGTDADTAGDGGSNSLIAALIGGLVALGFGLHIKVRRRKAKGTDSDARDVGDKEWRPPTPESTTLPDDETWVLDDPKAQPAEPTEPESPDHGPRNADGEEVM